MRNGRLLPLLVLGAVVALVGCESKRREAEPVKTTSETTRKTDDSSIKSKTETAQQGANAESKTRARSDTPKGDTMITKDEVVGMVTSYKTGKRIEVRTVNNDKRSFDLNDKKVTIKLDPDVKLGERVKVVEVRGEGGRHSITVKTIG